MNKEEAWEECENALRSVHQDRCIEFDCGCKELIKQIREILYV